jgi:hypothetical protein
VHRNCLIDTRFDPALRRLQDWDLCLHLSRRYDFHYLDEVLVEVRTGRNRISTGIASYVTALERITATHHEAFSGQLDAAAAVYMNAAALAARHGELALGAKLLRAAIAPGIRATARALGILGRRALG